MVERIIMTRAMALRQGGGERKWCVRDNDVYIAKTMDFVTHFPVALSCAAVFMQTHRRQGGD